jgi:hypothetical protein
LQEVEGVRTDVRVICGALLAGNWYVEQMRTKINESAPLSFKGTAKTYLQAYYPVKSLTNEKVDIKEIIRFVNSDSADTKLMTQSGKSLRYIPAKNIIVSSNDTSETIIEFAIKKNYLVTNDLFMLDVLAQNDWKRPIYFVSPHIITSLINAEPYLEQQGVVFHLTTEKNKQSNGIRLNTSVMVDNLITKYSWKSFDNEEQYIDPKSGRMGNTFKFYFSSLANDLIDKGDNNTAEKLLNTCVKTFKKENLPYNYAMLGIAQAYYRIEQTEKANSIVDSLIDKYISELDYYKSLSSIQKKSIQEDIRIATSVLQQLARLTSEFKQDLLYQKVSNHVVS